jgi:ligand-binding SRPBCC domain-containing protein
MVYELTDEFVVAADLARTWAFFSSAENLPRITPPWLRLRNVYGPERVKANSELEYTIRWMGLPVRWRTWIIAWDEPREFVDLQVAGPYAMWHHRHRFEETAEGTRCEGWVSYRLPFGPVGRAVHVLVVRRQLMEIFRYRRGVIGENLGWVRPILPDPAVRSAGRRGCPGDSSRDGCRR